MRGQTGVFRIFLYANGRGSGGWEEPGDSHPERIGHYFLGLLLLRGIVFWQEILARNVSYRASTGRARERKGRERGKDPREQRATKARGAPRPGRGRGAALRPR